MGASQMCLPILLSTNMQILDIGKILYFFFYFRHCTMDDVQNLNFIAVMCYQQKPDY